MVLSQLDIFLLAVLGIAVIVIMVVETHAYKEYQSAKHQVEAFVITVQASWKQITSVLNDVITSSNTQAVEVESIKEDVVRLQKQVDMLDIIIAGYGELLHTKAMTSLLRNDEGGPKENTYGPLSGA